MKKLANQNKTDANETKLNYAHPIYQEIEDSDEDSIQFYKKAGYPVKRLTLPHRLPHYYAIIDGDAEYSGKMDETEIAGHADRVKRGIDSMNRKASRDATSRAEHEISYDALLESGYDPDNSYSTENVSEEFRDPQDIHLEKVMLGELAKALEEVDDKQRRICGAVARNVPDRKMADEMGMAKSTYQGRKKKAMEEMGGKMKDWK